MVKICFHWHEVACVPLPLSAKQLCLPSYSRARHTLDGSMLPLVSYSEYMPDGTDRRTDARPMLYASFYARGQHNNAVIVIENHLRCVSRAYAIVFSET